MSVESKVIRAVCGMLLNKNTTGSAFARFHNQCKCDRNHFKAAEIPPMSPGVVSFFSKKHPVILLMRSVLGPLHLT